MVLEGIEAKLRTNKAETGKVSCNLHIERVMPQTWHPNWLLPAEMVEDEEAVLDRDRAIHTIGNLMLVSKRKILADQSVLFLNKYLVNKGLKVWDETAIEKRAVAIWPHAGGFEFVLSIECRLEGREGHTRRSAYGRLLALMRRKRLAGANGRALSDAVMGN